MTNCEDCVYYEYDPEADTNYCEADRTRNKRSPHNSS